MKRLYWDTVEFNNQRMFLTVTKRGLSFISNPGCGISQVYDFYRHQAFEFKYSATLTKPYREAITRYLNGERLDHRFPLDFCGDDDVVQKKVWRLVCQIPYGEVRTLGQLTQAVGLSLTQVKRTLCSNPALILVPTHRILANARQLGRFRESTEMKSQLLEMEAIMSGEN